jgi:hypothetical protein
MKRNNIINSHIGKTKFERDEYIKSVLGKREEHTISYQNNGTLNDDDEYEYPELEKERKEERKNKANRFILFFKEYWPNCVISVVGAFAFFFFVTFNVKIAEMNKDVSFLYNKLDENTRKIEKVSEDVSLLRSDVYSLKSDLKSLNDRFGLFIELFRQGEVNLNNN